MSKEAENADKKQEQSLISILLSKTFLETIDKIDFDDAKAAQRVILELVKATWPNGSKHIGDIKPIDAREQAREYFRWYLLQQRDVEQAAFELPRLVKDFEDLKLRLQPLNDKCEVNLEQQREATIAEMQLCLKSFSPLMQKYVIQHNGLRLFQSRFGSINPRFAESYFAEDYAANSQYPEKIERFYSNMRLFSNLYLTNYFHSQTIMLTLAKFDCMLQDSSCQVLFDTLQYMIDLIYSFDFSYPIQGIMDKTISFLKEKAKVITDEETKVTFDVLQNVFIIAIDELQKLMNLVVSIMNQIAPVVLIINSKFEGSSWGRTLRFDLILDAFQKTLPVLRAILVDYDLYTLDLYNLPIEIAQSILNVYLGFPPGVMSALPSIERYRKLVESGATTFALVEPSPNDPAATGTAPAPTEAAPAPEDAVARTEDTGVYALSQEMETTSLLDPPEVSPTNTPAPAVKRIVCKNCRTKMLSTDVYAHVCPQA